MISVACLVLVAFAVFAATMQRTSFQVAGVRLKPASSRRLRLWAWIIFGASLIPVSQSPQWPIAIAYWIGVLAAAALTVALIVSFAPRRLGPIVAALVVTATLASLITHPA